MDPSTRADILIIGGSGFIGAALARAAARAGRSVAYTWRSRPVHIEAAAHRVDLSEAGALEACIDRLRPGCIVYCAVPQPGSEPGNHPVISVEGVRRVAAALKKIGAGRLVYLSTNSVFSGQNGPYRETDQPDPHERMDRYRAYAVARAAGEQVALNEWDDTLVVRTANVNGRDVRGRLNTRLLDLVTPLSEGKEIACLTEAYISPTWVGDLAAGLLEVIDPGFEYRGVLHLAGSERTSYYDFARRLARQIRANVELVRPDPGVGIDNSLDCQASHAMLQTRFRDVREQLKAIFP